MIQDSKKFLEELITTPSPSGNEFMLQKKWMEYTKQFAHKVETDTIGNVIASINPDNPFKVLLAGHGDEIAFMVHYIDDKGFLYVTKAGGISPKIALGLKVRILGKNGLVKGVIGVPAEHHGGAKKDIDIEDIYIDCGATNKEDIEKYVTVGDYVIYDTDFDYLYNNNLVGRGLDNRTGAFIVAEVLRRVAEKNVNIGVYAASTVNEETNMGGAYFVGSQIEPTLAIACDVTFATDHPDVNPKKHGYVKLGSGPVLAKGAPINDKINTLLQNAAKDKNIPIQYELTPRGTGTDADKIRLTGKGVPIALVSLPLRYMHSPVEVTNLDDLEKEIQLITAFILNLTGEENFKPLD